MADATGKRSGVWLALEEPRGSRHVLFVTAGAGGTTGIAPYR